MFRYHVNSCQNQIPAKILTDLKVSPQSSNLKRRIYAIPLRYWLGNSTSLIVQCYWWLCFQFIYLNNSLSNI